MAVVGSRASYQHRGQVEDEEDAHDGPGGRLVPRLEAVNISIRAVATTAATAAGVAEAAVAAATMTSPWCLQLWQQSPHRAASAARRT